MESANIPTSLSTLPLPRHTHTHIPQSTIWQENRPTVHFQQQGHLGRRLSSVLGVRACMQIKSQPPTGHLHSGELSRVAKRSPAALKIEVPCMDPELPCVLYLGGFLGLRKPINSNNKISKQSLWVVWRKILVITRHGKIRPVLPHFSLTLYYFGTVSTSVVTMKMVLVPISY